MERGRVVLHLAGNSHTHKKALIILFWPPHFTYQFTEYLNLWLWPVAVNRALDLHQCFWITVMALHMMAS